jgi:hypothetical protein
MRYQSRPPTYAMDFPCVEACYLNWWGNASDLDYCSSYSYAPHRPENNKPSMAFTLLYLRPPPHYLPRHLGLSSSLLAKRDLSGVKRFYGESRLC